MITRMKQFVIVSTHSRPKAAGPEIEADLQKSIVSTHSRPKAAGCSAVAMSDEVFSFNTQPPEGGWFWECWWFGIDGVVSTHSRPKAAGNRWFRKSRKTGGFNTQPPEGGWLFKY